VRVRRPPQVFDEQFEHAHDLNLRRMQWDDDAATQLARVVGSGALPNLRRLNVAWNQIGDKGAKKLADALEKVRRLPLFSPPPRRVSRRWFCPPSQAVISPSLRWFCPALPLVVIPLFPSLRLDPRRCCRRSRSSSTAATTRWASQGCRRCAAPPAGFRCFCPSLWCSSPSPSPSLQALRRAFSACRDAHSQSGWSEERRNEAAAQIQALKRGQAVRRRSQAGKLGAVSEGSTPGGGRTPGGGKRGATAAGKGSDLAVSTASKSYPPRPVVVAKA